MSRRFALSAAALAAAAGPASATTYYVSPTGSDASAGTSAASPWASVAKVDATAFQPGDQILFQYGGQWNGGLDATSSGTAAAPITYGAYGNAALVKPTFSGSDAVASSAFTLVPGTTGTFQTTSAAPVNWVFDNHAFTREAQDATGSADPATDLRFVNGTAGSFYYNAASGTTYVNVGSSSLAGHTITAATRADAVNSYRHNNLVFKNLAVNETAQDDAGYGFRVQNSDNVRIVSCTATGTGKHGFGVIDSTGFVGTGLTATGSAPDLGYGGASAFVNYADANRQGTTAVWANCTYNQANGAYPALISHGDAGAVASVRVINLTSLNGFGTGVEIDPTSSAEAVTIIGGHFDGGTVAVNTDHALVSGVTVSGPTGNINVAGNGDVVSQCLITGISPDIASGHFGGIVVTGTNALIRGNTFDFASAAGAGLAILAANGGGTIADRNTFDSPLAVLFYIPGPVADYHGVQNTFAAGAGFFYTTGPGNDHYYDLAGWIASGYESVFTPAPGPTGSRPPPGTADWDRNPSASTQGTATRPTTTAVPEPASVAAAVSAVVASLVSRRRRPAR